MAIILPAASENNMLSFAVGATTPGNQQLKLYVNSVTTSNDALVAADFTEMSTLGYASKTLTKTSWVVTQNGSNKASAAYAQQTWTFTAGTQVTVYGYYVLDATTGLLLWFEAFSASKSVENNGDQIIITPTITLAKE
jgi:hypothetical protein